MKQYDNVEKKMLYFEMACATQKKVKDAACAA